MQPSKGLTCLFVILVLGLLSVRTEASSPVTLPSLLREFIDIEQITRFPSPTYETVQASSASRRSDIVRDEAISATTPVPGVESAVRTPRAELGTETVLFDSDGPGAIVHLCLRAAEGQGILRVYLDGSSTPIVEGSLEEIASGRIAPIVVPFVTAHEGTLGIDFPIPYQSHCRITLASDLNEWTTPASYQVAARVYEPGTVVETLSPAVVEKAQPLIAETAQILKGERKTEQNPDWSFRFPIQLSREMPIVQFDVARGHSGLISEIHLKPNVSDPALLRQVILVLCFDGRVTARVPLAEFFGTGPGIQPYRSMMTEVTTEGELVCRWPMPFAQEVAFAVEGPGQIPVGAENDKELKRKHPLLSLFRLRENPLFKRRESRQRAKRSQFFNESLVMIPEGINIEGYALVKPYSWTQQSMYFHADWKSQHELVSSKPQSWSIAELSGRGVYVGTTLLASNSVRDWWGRGGEKIYFDGRDTPRLIGTDSSDYFALAPASPTLFATALHGQSRCDGPRSFGHSSLYRWRILDAMPFNNGLKFDWEVKHTNAAASLSLEGVNYWYADPWHSENARRLDSAEVAIPSLPTRVVPKIAGAIEGESLVALRVDGSSPKKENLVHFEEAGPWSGDSHLVWQGIKPGNELVLGFEAPADGKYQVVAFLSQSFDYGIHRISLNDKPAGDPIDLFSPTPIRREPLDLGVFDLKKEGNRLSVRVVSSSKAASPKNCSFGLDCLVLKRIP